MSDAIRIDKWLWFARFFKTRSLAAKAVAAGVRVNETRISKPSLQVKPGDVLTFAQAKQVRVIRITAIGTRRGPAPEAQGLYEDLAPPMPPAPKETQGLPTREAAPDKRDRRAARALKHQGS